MRLTPDGPDESAAGVYSKGQMDRAIQGYVTPTKLAEVSNARVIGVAEVHSHEAGFGDFASRFHRGDVPVTSFRTAIYDDQKHFYFGGPKFYGQISDQDTFWPQDKVFLIVDHDCPICLVLIFAQVCAQMYLHSLYTFIEPQQSLNSAFIAPS